MSVRKDTRNRKTLIRACGTCGVEFLTTAGTPWLRQVPRDGKRQVNTYYCCETCFSASYRHRFDGKAKERRAERERNRDRTEYRKKRYAENRDRELAYARARYWADPEAARAANRYAKKKRRLLAGEGENREKFFENQSQFS